MKNEKKGAQNNHKIGGFEPTSEFARSLLPLLDALGWKGSNIDLVEALVDQANIMDEDGLIETFANLKYKSFVINARSAAIEKRVLPCLFIKKNNIYCVVGKEDDYFTIYNTKEGLYQKIKNLGFGRKILVFSPLDSIDFNLTNPQKGWFSHLLLRFKKEFSYVIGISLLLTLVAFITPLFIMLIYSQIGAAENGQILMYLGLAVFVFLLAGSGFKYLRSYLLSYTSSRIGALVSNELFRRILYLPPKYIEMASVQSQLNRIRDFESIKDFFSGSALTSLIDIPLSMIMMIGLIFIGGTVVFVPLLAYALMLTGGFIVYGIYQRINHRNIGQFNKKNKLQNDMLENMTDIRMTGNKKRWFDEYDKSTAESLHGSHESAKFLLIVNAMSQAVVNITLILSIYVCVVRVMHGQMDGGALFSSFIIISRILAPLRSGFSTISQFSKVKKSINQLNNFMGLKIEARPGTIITLHKHLEGDIEFKNIFLKYGQEVIPPLANINYLQKKNTIAVVTGHGGCGKSSFLKLLLGMYTPLSGMITVDNMNLMQVDKLRLRKSIAYLPAEPYSFQGSILFNLYLSKPDAAFSEIEDVLKRVGIYNQILELPESLNTAIRELPEQMKNDRFIKKINFAMMLLRKSPICLIDEIEVGADPSDYAMFFENIKELKNSSTVILTTTKQFFFNLADDILWLDAGHIQEYGPAASVIAKYQKFQTKILKEEV